MVGSYLLPGWQVEPDPRPSGRASLPPPPPAIPGMQGGGGSLPGHKAGRRRMEDGLRVWSELCVISS